MKLKQGYYGLLDLLLSLREIYMGERFKPFCKQLTNLHNKLNEQEYEQIFKLGDETNGYLDAIANSINIVLNIGSSVEEIFLKLREKPSLLLNDDSMKQEVNFILNLWQNYFNIEISKNNKQLTDKVFEIDENISKQGILNYLTSITDRFEIRDNIIDFHIKPDFEVEIAAIENIIIMPSLYACRNFTFWYNDNNFIFYIGLESKEITPIEPSDMLLLKTSAFNDKTRLKILKLLINKSMSANEIAKILDVNASTISRHLKIFKDTNFVDIQAKEGNSIYYYLNEIKIKKALDDIYNFIKGEEL
ncbi:ArsR/SmtB family transcription factor [Abyssisolibacter fermentans]|uniref:ArsR/SmtB family transcription factor n=1 Tax=Abyssisolibacter fermentans TaxID=1766203 RepID=UPI00083063CB|nr:metalloregulator ArsR/SmtB family transcription factor [Abyssisolibacter fermentans]